MDFNKQFLCFCYNPDNFDDIVVILKRNGREQDDRAGKPQIQNNAKGIQREPDRADAGKGVAKDIRQRDL